MNWSFREVEHGTPDYHRVVAFRERLLRFPLGLRFEAEQLETEREERHFVVDGETGELAACCSYRHVDDQTVKLRQMAVAESCRGRGLGRELVEWTLRETNVARGCDRVICHARAEAAGFYEKLGFRRVGEPFEEVGLRHVRMERAWKSPRADRGSTQCG